MARRSTGGSRSRAAAPSAATGRRPLSRHLVAELSVRVKIFLLVLFSTVAVVAVGAVGQRGISTVEHVGSGTIQEVALPALNLGQIRESVAREQRELFQAVSYRNQPDIDVSLLKIQERQAEVDKSLAALQNMKLTEEQLSLINVDLMGSVSPLQSVIKGELIPLANHPMTEEESRLFSQTWKKKAQPLAEKAENTFASLEDSFERQMAISTREMNDTNRQSVFLLWTIGGLTALLAFLGGAWVSRLILRPLATVQRVLLAVAGGDLTQQAVVRSRDEIGRMAEALSAAQEYLRATITTVTGTSATLASSAKDLSAVSAQVADGVEQTTSQANSVAATAEEVSRNVQSVAAATEEMTGSIRDISVSSNEAVRVAETAVTEAEAASATIAKLGDSSAEIGDVVKVITSIAEQTNLLALNATIEAARAGDSGKGFAVVASEVKELAQETARATDDISRRIETIQNDTRAAVTAVAKIAQIIEEINNHQTAIASAVEEQNATTSEMARNVTEAAGGASSIAGSIEGVAAAAGSSRAGIGEAQHAADALAHLSDELRDLTTRFRL
ncbi:MAG: hypothetical protein QG622_3263 [Actinomycetota bacterium]|nr:hypothetical protein [Actinomycetota bacterium]